MSYTTTITAKRQITIPKDVFDKIGAKVGQKVNIYPTRKGSFIGKPHRKSRIMDLLGDLKHLDKGEPLNVIREKAQEAAAREIVQRLKKR